MSIDLLHYKLGNIFVGKSMYMQQKIGAFKEGFSKNTFRICLCALLEPNKTPSGTITAALPPFFSTRINNARNSKILQNIV